MHRRLERCRLWLGFLKLRLLILRLLILGLLILRLLILGLRLLLFRFLILLRILIALNIHETGEREHVDHGIHESIVPEPVSHLDLITLEFFGLDSIDLVILHLLNGELVFERSSDRVQDVLQSLGSIVADAFVCIVLRGPAAPLHDFSPGLIPGSPSGFPVNRQEGL